MANVRIILLGLLDAHLDKSGECWIWTGGTTKINGHSYGRVSLQGRRFYVHRLAYQIWIGSIPHAGTVTQTCGSTLCCRPEHLQSAKGS